MQKINFLDKSIKHLKRYLFKADKKSKIQALKCAESEHQ